MKAGALLRTTRERHGLSQAALARRAATTPRQIGRIERGEISPTVRTLERLLAVMGERLELDAVPVPGGDQSDAEIRDALALTRVERVQQAFALSETLTHIASRREERRGSSPISSAAGGPAPRAAASPPP